jgi:hypothetical protein
MIYIFDPVDLFLADPLEDPNPLARAVNRVTGERTLMARGGSGGGGGRHRRGGARRGPRIPAQIRASRHAANLRAAQLRRQRDAAAARLAQSRRTRELSKAATRNIRYFQKAAAEEYRADLARFRQIEKDYAEAERIAAARRRLAFQFVTRQTPYRKRVTAGIRAQLGRGEAPSIARATGNTAEQRRDRASLRDRARALIDRVSRYAEYLQNTYGGANETVKQDFLAQPFEKQVEDLNRALQLKQEWEENGQQPILPNRNFFIAYHFTAI